MKDKKEDISGVLEESQKLLEKLQSILESANQSNNSISEWQRGVGALHLDAQLKSNELNSILNQVISAKTQIASDQTVIATKSDHIQKAQEHADSVRASLDRILTSVTQQATEAEGLKSRAQSASDSSTSLLAAVQLSKATIEKDASIIEKQRIDSESNSSITKALAEKADEIESKLKTYEGQLTELVNNCQLQLKTIEELLPGATAAGLANAFDQRRKTFLQPHTRWQWLFIGSIFAIVFLAVTGLIELHSTENRIEYKDIIWAWLSRLPVAGGLIWLALHSSREAAMAKRLEEDYGYKSAIAASFLGFNKQMSQITASKDPSSPIAKLCEDTLNTIASPPGRIYDKHKLVVSPSDELLKAAQSVSSIATTQKK